MQYDYLIVGAGLAGCAAARLLAQSGARVLAVDRADLEAKDKLCGGLLTPRAQRMMARLYGDAAESLYTQSHTSMRVLFGGHDHVIDRVLVRGLNRRDLDRFVLGEARAAGVDVRDRTRVTALDISGRRATLSSREGEEVVEFDVLVAADGAGSWTRREVLRQAGVFGRGGQGAQASQGIQGDRAAREGQAPQGAAPVDRAARPHQSSFVPRFARPIEAEVLPSIEAFVAPSGQPLTGKYNSAIRGYCWYVPCGEVANIGCDGQAGTSPERLRRVLAAFAEDVGVEVDDANIRGAFIPTGGSILLQAEVGDTPVYFLGDAAGLAAPATGEGIYFALKSAASLARSLTVPGCASYRSLMDGEAATLLRQHAMMPLLFNERVMEGTISLSHATGIGSERMARFALKLFASF